MVAEQLSKPIVFRQVNLAILDGHLRPRRDVHPGGARDSRQLAELRTVQERVVGDLVCQRHQSKEATEAVQQCERQVASEILNTKTEIHQHHASTLLTSSNSWKPTSSLRLVCEFRRAQ